MTQKTLHKEVLAEGIQLLRQPVLPLIRMIPLLYLAGPFETVDAILDELREPIETGGVAYEQPSAFLRPYLPILKEFERIKHPAPNSLRILTKRLEEANIMEALESRVTQHVLTLELERINSLLCGPCACSLCCVGPDDAMSQDFFEIPLSRPEADAFALQKIDSRESRAKDALAEPPLLRDGQAFYAAGPAIYHWRTGWSLILPRNSTCPHLKHSGGGCRIYPQRPEVCRRPQIFAYALERAPEQDTEENGRARPASIIRQKLLAVWDCPYVKLLKDEISAYAELCGLTPVFKRNKA